MEPPDETLYYSCLTPFGYKYSLLTYSVPYHLLSKHNTFNFLSIIRNSHMGWLCLLYPIIYLYFLLFHFPTYSSSLAPLCNSEHSSALLQFKNSFSVDGSVYFFIYVSLVVFGLVIGVVGSLLAMRRYLKV